MYFIIYKQYNFQLTRHESKPNAHQQMIGLRRCVIYKHIWISLSHKKWNNATCSNIDRLRDYCTMWTEVKHRKTVLYGISYMWNLFRLLLFYYYCYCLITQRNPYTKQNRLTKETNLWLPKGRGNGGEKIKGMRLTDTNCYIWNR